MTDAEVIVIGAGVSGLAAAHHLKVRGHDVLVLERQVQIGGNAVSERIGGFLMEHGPSTMNAHVPIASEISTELGLDGEKHDLGLNVRRRYLVKDDGLAAIGTGPFGFMTSGYLSTTAKLRMMVEFMLPHGNAGPEESVMEFCTRRFGREFAERVIDPMVAGIYGGGRAADLSITAVFPKLAALEASYGSVILGMIHAWRQGRKMPGSRLFSWTDGMATLPRTLAGHLSGRIKTGVAVRRIDRDRAGYCVHVSGGESVRANAVIIATQPHVAANLLEVVDAEGAEAAQQIDAPPLAVVFLGFPREQVAHPLDGLGFLTAEAEGRGLLGAQFCSTMFPGRAPAGYVAVSGFVGGVRAPELARLPPPELIELARREFLDLIGAEGDPTVARVRHWQTGLPQYVLGHGDRVRKLCTTQKRAPGLFLVGNYLAGPSVAVCVEVAREIAVAVSSYCHSARRATSSDGRHTDPNCAAL